MTPDDFNKAASSNSDGLEGLSVWLVESIRWDAHRQTGNHSEDYVVAKDIQDVWKWLSIDRSDGSVEIRSIIHKAPVLAVVPHANREVSQPPVE